MIKCFLYNVNEIHNFPSFCVVILHKNYFESDFRMARFCDSPARSNHTAKIISPATIQQQIGCTRVQTGIITSLN